jgi:hypothetical protein
MSVFKKAFIANRELQKDRHRLDEYVRINQKTESRLSILMNLRKFDITLHIKAGRSLLSRSPSKETRFIFPTYLMIHNSSCEEYRADEGVRTRPPQLACSSTDQLLHTVVEMC